MKTVFKNNSFHFIYIKVLQVTLRPGIQKGRKKKRNSPPLAIHLGKWIKQKQQ